MAQMLIISFPQFWGKLKVDDKENWLVSRRIANCEIQTILFALLLASCILVLSIIFGS